MSSIDHATVIAERIEDARRTVKRLAGDRYAERVRVWVEQVEYVARMTPCKLIEVPTRVNFDKLPPASFLWLLAGVAEAIEKQGAEGVA